MSEYRRARLHQEYLDAAVDLANASLYMSHGHPTFEPIKARYAEARETYYAEIGIPKPEDQDILAG